MSVVPTENDFLFIKPGGEWYKVRQKTAWTSERLRNLATGYSWYRNDEYKRRYVQKNIIDAVHKNGGRFLRPGAGAGVWDLVEDENYVMVDIMRILRQMRKGKGQTVGKFRKVQGSIYKHLCMVERRVEEMSSALETLKIPGTKQTATGGPWTNKQATMVLKRLDSMLKTATTCTVIMGIASDELTDDQSSSSSSSDDDDDDDDDNSDDEFFRKAVARASDSDNSNSDNDGDFGGDSYSDSDEDYGDAYCGTPTDDDDEDKKRGPKRKKRETYKKKAPKRNKRGTY
eukprot:scaffold3849_cov179-Amphora_coffeaeformis.AAC.6